MNQAARAAVVVALAAACAVPAAAAKPLRAAVLPPVPAVIERLPAPQPSPQAQRLLAWVLASGDHGGMPFIVLDKRETRVWVHDAAGRLLGTAPVLLGAARGDHTVPGIGDRPLSKVRPHEKTTPAGRFPIEPGVNTRGEYVLWLDYEAGVSMHRVLTTSAKENRLRRLQTPTIADNRVSFGCVNVPAGFFGRVLEGNFLHLPRDRAVAYVLPETRPLRSVFPSVPPIAAARAAPT